MANIYDVGDGGQFGVAPPKAPIPGALRQARGRLGGMKHIGVLSKLHPNHPIFKKFPGLAAFVAHHAGGSQVAAPQMPPGIVPPPGSDTAPMPNSHTAPPVPQPGSDKNPGVVDPAGVTPSATAGLQPDPTQGGRYPWMQLPGDLSGLGAQQWGAPPGPAGADPQAAFSDAAGRFAGGHGGVNPRDLLMQRYHTAGPQQPKLTSRGALNHFLGQQTQKRNRSVRARTNILPQRPPRAY